MNTTRKLSQTLRATLENYYRQALSDNIKRALTHKKEANKRTKRS